MNRLVVAILMLLLLPGAAAAHVSQQGFVLLLPTEVYSAAGIGVVVATVLLMTVFSARRVHRLFSHREWTLPEVPRVRVVTSLLGLMAYGFSVFIGLAGPRDPLSNLAPLGLWTVWWVALVALAGLLGDIWRWVNPWTGLYQLTIGGRTPLLRLPEVVGYWPAVLGLAAFWGYLLADPAPDDPARVGVLLAVYWLAMFAGMVLFGPGWLRQAEFGTLVFSLYSRLSAVRPGGFGVPGWAMMPGQAPLSIAAFAIVLLAAGSFDGVNETFWWLAQIGINPLAFPGRSAIVGPTLWGLGGSIAALFIVFAAAVWLGVGLIGRGAAFWRSFSVLALSLLPIALGYHVAHYLTSFLVSGQYALAALSDPFASGADYLGLQPFYVTTGFFNHIDTVRVIWLTQAGAVVVGHVWAVLLAHRLAADLFPIGRQAAIATAPLSVFMIGYTTLGLWLLAAPRGA